MKLFLPLLKISSLNFKYEKILDILPYNTNIEHEREIKKDRYWTLQTKPAVDACEEIIMLHMALRRIKNSCFFFFLDLFLLFRFKLFLFPCSANNFFLFCVRYLLSSSINLNLVQNLF